MTESNFVDPDDSKGGFISRGGKDFAADTPKGAVVESGGRGEVSRIQGSPRERIEDNRDIKDTDPHVNEAINTIIDWVCGDGYNISPRNIKNVDTDTEDSVNNLREIMAGSGFWTEVYHWVEAAATDGHGFMELVVEDDQFKPRLLPTEKVIKKTDEYGQVEQYGLLPPDTPSPGANISEIPDDATTYEPHEIAELTFIQRPPESFGRSLVEPVNEQADILRDMEIDYARFVATKAYPPILWTCGTEDEKWTEDQIEGWLDTVESVEPDSVLAAPHDVDHDIVGTTSTSSTAGAMRLEETFQHFINRIVTGLGVPDVLMNMQEGTRSTEAVMPDFKRRITKFRNVVKDAVENQIFRSLLEQSIRDADPIVPEFEFGEHSSSEKRLEVDKLLKLFNNGFLTRKAFAERAGIDPETEMPDDTELEEIVGLLQEISGMGDQVQNSQGGNPTDTGGGADSSGGEVTSRDNPESVDDDSRNRQAPTEDEDV